jgi:hypothetical protein
MSYLIKGRFYETAYIWLAHKHYCATCLSVSFETQLSPLPLSIIRLGHHS